MSAGGDRTMTLREARQPLARGRRYALVHLFAEVGRLRDGPLLLEDDLVLGRDASCGVPLDDESISRRHARLWRDNDLLYVEDLGSRNGTQVGGHALRKPAQLDDGDVLRAGRNLFLVTTEPELFAPGWASRCGLLVGGPAIRRIGELVARFAQTSLPFLIAGETGTGKELVAREVHRMSGRGGAFVAVNCGAVPAAVFESEMFGHRKGAFTGAGADKQGLMLEATDGTLLLDEIGEMAPENQVKLLRAIETGEVRPLGATRVERTTARFIAATNRSLEKEVQIGRFRADLYQRLGGVYVAVPALRERPEDVVLLAEHFLRAHATESAKEVALATGACEALLVHDWPGNVRELERTIRAAAHQASAEGRRQIALEDLPERLAAATPPDDEDAERWERVVAALREHGGNVTRAARAVDLHRAQVYALLRRHGRSPEDFRSSG